MPKIKICGITCKKEIEYINNLKPDYAGFILAKSKRKIEIEKCKELCSMLDTNIIPVGVFRNQSIKEILNIVTNTNLKVIQLHGNEDLDFIKKLKHNIISDLKLTNKDIEIWKAFSIDEISDIKKYAEQFCTINCNGNTAKKKLIDKYLIDGQKPGSGNAYSLDKLKNALENISKDFKYFLAGGLNIDNVEQRVELAKPFGIDVSSGVEIVNEKGIRIKSYEKMKKLIHLIKTTQNK